MKDVAFAIRTVLRQKLCLKRLVLHLKDIQELEFLRE